MNNRMRTCLILLLCLAILPAFRNVRPWSYPPDFFGSPVRSPLRLSGTFGELRANHFHSGIDIKGYIGQPLLAVADGFISRIRVQAGGYGNVLYLEHPNGYTSVYAHLNRFSGPVENYVKSIQYEQESFEVEILPEAGRFPVSKGEVIGEMGTTGYSFGPHLHFEIRNTDTEMPVNPLLFGLEAADSRPPRMQQLRTYALSTERNTLEAKTYDLVSAAGRYGVRGDTLLVPSAMAGFALKVYDFLDGAPNWNGVYEVSMYVDDSLAFAYTMETFAFRESRYLNAHLDYEEQVARNSYFNRLFRLPGNRLSAVYRHDDREGVVPLSRDRACKVTIAARDVAGNESTLEFWARHVDRPLSADRPPYHYFLPYDEENAVQRPGLSLYFPEGAFYEDLYLFLEEAADQSSDIYSSVFHVHDARTPVHTYYDLAIRPTRLPEALESKAFIAYCYGDNRVRSYGGDWRDGRLHTQVRDLGDFCIMVDTVPPAIQPVDVRSDMRGRREMNFIISDDVATAGNVEGLRYRATIDGRWILMGYDAKNDRLTHTFDGSIPAGSHQFRLEVTDGRGNRSVFEREMIL